jgi:hypothetical protein
MIIVTAIASHLAHPELLVLQAAADPQPHVIGGVLAPTPRVLVVFHPDLPRHRRRG